MPPGGALFAEGDRNCDFFAILAGTVAVVGRGGAPPRSGILSTHGRGRFLGEVGLLTGQAALCSAVVAGRAGAGRAGGPAQGAGGHDAALGDLILRAYLIRRSIMISLGVGVRIVGSRYSPDARRLRDFAARNRIPAPGGSTWRPIRAPRRCSASSGVDARGHSLVILFGRRVLRNPGNAELAGASGCPPAAKSGAAG